VPYLHRYSLTKLAIFLRPVFSASRVQYVSDLNLNLHYLHRYRRINEDAYFHNRVQLLRRTASDPQHSLISLTANSAIAGGVLGTD